MISGLVGDASDTAAEWWSKVLKAVDAADRVWLSSSPIDRFEVEPVVPDELLQGRWVRVNCRVCSMLLAAVPESIKADIISRKCIQSAPSILFRLHTIINRVEVLRKRLSSDSCASLIQPRTLLRL